MPKSETYKWEFRARFRRHAFGWRSQPAIKRVREAVSEIKKVARKDPLLAGEGAVLFLEKLSPAIEQVDGSSGSIGNAVYRAVDTLVPIIAGAAADAKTRERWLDRLWDAYQADGMCYIESLGGHWGELCASGELASRWADRLIGTCRAVWTANSTGFRFFNGAVNCSSCLLAAGRHEELLELLELDPYPSWHHRRFGTRALARMGRTDDAIRYAEEGRALNDDTGGLARECEEILLAAGRTDEAYRRYGLMAGWAGTYLAWFRAVARKYPHLEPARILADLVALSPGEEGKWFAAAKDAGLFDAAVELARRSPCAPQTLTRAARDFARERPGFALEAGMAALHWLAEGHGYEVAAGDVHDAFTHTLDAARNAGCADETLERVRTLVAGERSSGKFVTRVLGRELGLA